MQTRSAARKAAWQASPSTIEDDDGSCRTKVLGNIDIMLAIFNTLSPKKFGFRALREQDVETSRQRSRSHAIQAKWREEPRRASCNEVAEREETWHLHGDAFCLPRHKPLRGCTSVRLGDTAALNHFALKTTLELFMLRINDGTLARVPVQSHAHACVCAMSQGALRECYVRWYIYPTLVTGERMPSVFTFFAWFNHDMVLRLGELAWHRPAHKVHWSQLFTAASYCNEGGSVHR
eukprot:jgi/Chlat1/5646/Chrsp369S00869